VERLGLRRRNAALFTDCLEGRGSPKFAFSILHRPARMGAEDAQFPYSSTAGRPQDAGCWTVLRLTA
jgi:hypothetical protein